MALWISGGGRWYCCANGLRRKPRLAIQHRGDLRKWTWDSCMNSKLVQAEPVL